MDYIAYVIQTDQIKKQLYTLAYLYMGDEVHAVRAVEEAVYQGFKQYKHLGEAIEFHTWLNRMLIDVCRSTLKKQKQESFVTDIPNGFYDRYNSVLYNEYMDTLPQNLICKVHNLPDAYEDIVMHAEMRYRSSIKRKKFTAITAGILCMVVAAFVLIVNTSVKTAYTLRQIPVIGQLAKTAAFSEGTKKAMEIPYAQPINIIMKQDGIRLEIEYVIADGNQVRVYYTLTDKDGKNLRAEADLSELWDSYYIWHEYGNDGELLIVDIGEEEMVVPLDVNFKVFDYVQDGLTEKDAECLTEFETRLVFDSDYVEPILDTISVNMTFQDAGDRFSLVDIDIYQTYIRLNFEEDIKDTALLRNLDVYIIDRNGNKTEKVIDTLSRRGNGSSPHFNTYRIECDLFSKGENFTVIIDSAEWIPKDFAGISVNLSNQSVQNLPQGMELIRAEMLDDKAIVILKSEHLWQGNDALYKIYSPYMESVIRYHHDGSVVSTLVVQDYFNKQISITPDSLYKSKFDQGYEIKFNLEPRLIDADAVSVTNMFSSYSDTSTEDKETLGYLLDLMNTVQYVSTDVLISMRTAIQISFYKDDRHVKSFMIDNQGILVDLDEYDEENLDDRKCYRIISDFDYETLNQIYRELNRVP